MKLKKFLAVLLVCFMILTGTAFSEPVENALTPCSDESFFAVLKLNDTQNFLKWLFSRENIDTFMPLILASEDSNEIIGVIEMISAFAENTPLKSAVILGGLEQDDSKIPEPVFQMAFTVKPESAPIVKRISDGSADAVDFAKLFLGNDSPLASFFETMIKVEKASDGILKIDNEVFVKAVEDVVILGLSEDGVKASVNALEHSDLRFFAKFNRKFSTDDFAFLHISPSMSAILSSLDDDDDKESDDIDLTKYFDKPFNAEFGFERIPDKFILSMAYNLKESLNKKYHDKTFKNETLNTAVEGGNIKISGEKAPLLALGGFMDLSLLKEEKETLSIWKGIVRHLNRRFGLKEDDVEAAFKGAFSLTVNDSESIEGIRVPALYSYISTEASEKIFEHFSNSPHFHKVKEDTLQIDSSVSAESIIIENKNGSLGVHLANLEKLSKSPVIKPTLQELLNEKSISSFWIDFAEIQSWIAAPENGLLIMLEPIARFTGNGEIFDSFKDILSSELSVPSIAFSAESLESAKLVFNIAEIDPSNGFLAKVIKMSRKFINSDDKNDKAEEKESKQPE